MNQYICEGSKAQLSQLNLQGNRYKNKNYTKALPMLSIRRGRAPCLFQGGNRTPKIHISRRCKTEATLLDAHNQITTEVLDSIRLLYKSNQKSIPPLRHWTFKTQSS